jgi:thioredoxin:protein disulfide reductase
MIPTVSVVALTAVLLAGQNSSTVSKSTTADTPHLTVTTSTSATAVSAGESLSLFVDVVPKPRMHVYAPEEKAQQAVSVTVDRVPGVAAKPPVFPKGERAVFAPTGDTQIVYSQPFRVEVPAMVVKSRKSGALTMSGTLRYQACDDKVCYIAKSVPLTWEVTVR